MRAAFLLLWAATLAAGLSLGAPTWWTGPAALFVLLVLVLAGLSVLPARGIDADDGRGAGAGLVLALASGLALAVILWLASLWIFKASSPGTLLLLVAVSYGAPRAWRHRKSLASSVTLPAIAVLLAATALALHLHAGNEIVDGGQLRFTYRFDWDRHLHIAGLMRTRGLPLVGLAGAAAEPLAPAGHRGLGALLVGIQELTATTPYQAMRILAVIGVQLICGAALALASRWRLPSGLRLAAALSPLSWGGLVLAVEAAAGRLSGMTDLYMKAAFRPALAGGAAFHNQTQAIAVALTFGAFVALDAHRRSRDRPLSLVVLASSLLVAGGLVKPSCLVVVGPAWLIVLVATRAQAGVLLASVGPLAVGLVLKLLPRLVTATPPGVGWRVSLTRLLDGDGLATVVLLVGIGVPLGGVWLVARLRRHRSRSYQWYDVALIAVVGGALFWRLFEETARPWAGNSSWPLTASVTLLAPWCFVRVARLKARPRWLRIGGALLLSLHLAAGLHYAWHYPKIRPRSVPTAKHQALTALLALTPEDARVLIEPQLTPSPAWGYVDRPAPLFRTFSPVQDADVRAWKRLAKGKKVRRRDALLVSRQAVILSGSRERLLAPVLGRLGFSRTERVGRYVLWLKP